MRFYRIYESDGTCKIICMHCFATVGVAPEPGTVSELESRHVCGQETQDVPGIPQNSFTGHSAGRSGAEVLRQPGTNGGSENRTLLHRMLLVAAIAVFLYLVPTLLELVAVARLNPWVAIILPGDAVGCAVLMAVFGRWRMGFSLYLLLTMCESCLYFFRLLQPWRLALVTDFVPTLAVILLLQFRAWSERAAVS